MSFLLALLLLVAIAVIAGFVLPSQVHVERQMVIDAPPEKIFPHVSDYGAWDAWSPWANIDPNAKMTVEGEGVGQKMSWASDHPEVGTGSQQIVQLDAPRRMKSRMEFENMGVSDIGFVLEPVEDKTLVTWSLDTDMREGMPLIKQPVSTYMGFFMDSMVGKSYEKGLATLKSVVEG
ncbi:MAG: SRPBCC family protein [Cyanobacteria bacterium P01_D01_bin.105]